MERNSYRYGFTLVELSIVLVIIGLIVGAVIGGRSLIHAGELRQVISEWQEYDTIMNAFYLQYDALPGDIPNASDYWTSCTDSGLNYCNGNDDGYIAYSPVNGTASDDYERFRAWQHLMLAGFIGGNYTGESGPPYTIGANVGTSKSGMITGYELYTYPSPLNFATAKYRPLLKTWGYSVSPADMRALESKIDDGQIDSGNLHGWGSAGTGDGNCYENTTPRRYLTHNYKTCIPYYFFKTIGW